MSIKISVSAGTLKTEASLKDSAYGELMQFIFKNQEGMPLHGKVELAKADQPSKPDGIDQVKGWLNQHTASEVLTRLSDWKTNPEKITLMGAWHEASGGEEGWRSANMEEEFGKAKETFPKNFPRDVRVAIDDGLIGSVTARSYKVGRVGWNRIADSIAKIESE